MAQWGLLAFQAKFGFSGLSRDAVGREAEDGDTGGLPAPQLLEDSRDSWMQDTGSIYPRIPCRNQVQSVRLVLPREATGFHFYSSHNVFLGPFSREFGTEAAGS